MSTIYSLPALKKQSVWQTEAQCTPLADGYDVRRTYIREHSWFILTEETADTLAKFLRNDKVIEVGAGTGYLAAHMRQRGVRHYRAYDHFRGGYYNRKVKHYGTKKRNAMRLNLSLYDTVVMCWPTYNADFAARIISRMRSGQWLVFQGEGYGGCTGDDTFHALLEDNFTPLKLISDKLNYHHHRWDGIYDAWFVYVKN